jgi:hypothetical protein
MTPALKRVVAAGFALIVGIELVVLVAPDRRFALWTAAAMAAIAVLTLRWLLVRDDLDAVEESRSRDPAETLRAWLARTETLIQWSEGTRADWDRHLRPMLARQFELATGARKTKSANVFHVTAEMVFGKELWPWVDPDNVSPTGRDETGPGRGVLDEILQRLERV